jgi:hypothetical protein
MYTLIFRKQFYCIFSGLNIIGHGNPDNNLESPCILMAVRRPFLTVKLVALWAVKPRWMEIESMCLFEKRSRKFIWQGHEHFYALEFILCSSWTLNKCDGLVWTGFIWLRIGASGELL